MTDDRPSRDRLVLRRLDAAVVPPLRHVLRAVEARLRRLVRWERNAGRARFVRMVAAHPLAVAALAGAVIFTASAVHLARTMIPPVPEEDLSRAPLEVGPLVGADLERYREGRHALLAALDLDDDLRAVVSFTDYVASDDLRLPPGVTLEAVLLQIQGQAQTIPVLDDPAAAVDAALAAARQHVDEEIVEVERLLDEALLDDPAFEADYESRLDELQATRDLLSAGAPLVFGAVVVAPTDTLRALVDQEGIRIVDPGGPADATRSTVFHGVLPEDVERATVGRAL